MSHMVDIARSTSRLDPDCAAYQIDARAIGLSRSSFAERFAAYVEMPPMQYIARWRLQIAARLLETPNVSVAQAAAEVGHQSEAAFHRAFKRHTGVAPGTWRRERGLENLRMGAAEAR